MDWYQAPDDLPGVARGLGRHGIWPEVHIFRLADGRVVEHWDVIDQLSLRAS